MKILMLTPYLPYPPVSGGQTRSYNLIKYLAKKHEITLFSLIKEEKEREFVGELEKFCRKVRIFPRPKKPWTPSNILKTGLGFYPFLVVRNLSDEEKIAVEEEIRGGFDLIHAENFYVMPHIPKEIKIPILLVVQTIEYRGYQRFVNSLPWPLIFMKPFLWIDILKLRHWEEFYWRNVNFLATVSPEDRDYIQSRVEGRKVEIVPSGVDFDHFNEELYPENDYPTVLFGAANFKWIENREGAKILLSKIWPLIKSKVKKAKLWIVGQYAPEVLASYQGQQDVLIGEIKDVREAYQRSWLLVAPLRSGGGSRLKFYEAMACGLPIVTTPEGIAGIEAENRKEAIVADNEEELAQGAIELLLNRKEAEEIGALGKKLVKEQYTWEKSAETLNKLYREIGHGERKD
jgi:glycosyltransferase involved in cell wall biosynthesis